MSWSCQKTVNIVKQHGCRGQKPAAVTFYIFTPRMMLKSLFGRRLTEWHRWQREQKLLTAAFFASVTAVVDEHMMSLRHTRKKAKISCSITAAKKLEYSRIIWPQKITYLVSFALKQKNQMLVGVSGVSVRGERCNWNRETTGNEGTQMSDDMKQRSPGCAPLKSA